MQRAALFLASVISSGVSRKRQLQSLISDDRFREQFFAKPFDAPHGSVVMLRFMMKQHEFFNPRFGGDCRRQLHCAVAPALFRLGFRMVFAVQVLRVMNQQIGAAGKLDDISIAARLLFDIGGIDEGFTMVFDAIKQDTVARMGRALMRRDR